MSVLRLTSAAEVLVATGHDPYVRGSLRWPTTTVGWSGYGAVVWRATGGEDGAPSLLSHGDPLAVAHLIGELLPELRDGQRITVPRGTAALLPASVAFEPTDWDFRWCDGPPPVQPAEERVVAVTGDQVRELLAVAAPHASAQPGDPGVRLWLGVAGPDGMLACAADTSAAAGVGHLSSIAVHPAARGQGLGAAVTAALTRQLFAAGADLVTLGMYAANTAGRALYDHLGMHDHHHFSSGLLQIRSRP